MLHSGNYLITVNYLHIVLYDIIYFLLVDIYIYISVGERVVAATARAAVQAANHSFVRSHQRNRSNLKCDLDRLFELD